jgi:hypothetical protein
MSETVCFTYRNPDRPANDEFLPGREMLVNSLREEHGLEAVFTNQAEKSFTVAGDGTTLVDTYDFADTPDVGRPDPLKARRLELGSAIGVILNRQDRSFKAEDLNGEQVWRKVPTFNPNEVRSLGHRQNHVHQEVLDPLGVAMPTRLITGSADIDDFLTAEASRATKYTAMPNVARGSKGIETLARDEVAGWFADNPDLQGKYLLRPAYDLTQPMPGLRPFDDASQELFELSNNSLHPKRLRMYGMYAGGETRTLPVARLVDGDWFFVDPDSVPEELHTKTREVIGKVAELKNVKAVQGACDWAYGAYDGKPQEWRVAEARLRTPYMLGPNKHPEVSRRLHTMFAGQIAVAARTAHEPTS